MEAAGTAWRHAGSSAQPQQEPSHRLKRASLHHGGEAAGQGQQQRRQGVGRLLSPASSRCIPSTTPGWCQLPPTITEPRAVPSRLQMMSSPAAAGVAQHGGRIQLDAQRLGQLSARVGQHDHLQAWPGVRGWCAHRPRGWVDGKSPPCALGALPSFLGATPVPASPAATAQACDAWQQQPAAHLASGVVGLAPSVHLWQGGHGRQGQADH